MVKRKKKKVIVEALTIKLNNKVRRSLSDEETLEHMLHFCRDILFARKFIIITHTHTHTPLLCFIVLKTQIKIRPQPLVNDVSVVCV